MRGQSNDTLIVRSDEGSTPAHAGRRVEAGPEMLTIRIHPRMCGEEGFRALDKAALPE